MVTEVRIALNPNPLPDVEREAILAAPVFGEVFTDHMVTMSFRDGEWGPLELQPFAPLALSPATLALHYGQSIFEALKAYSLPDGTAALFRPDQNAARMGDERRRIAIPELPDGCVRAGLRVARRGRPDVGARRPTARRCTCGRSCSAPRRTCRCGPRTSTCS